MDYCVYLRASCHCKDDTLTTEIIFNIKNINKMAKTTKVIKVEKFRDAEKGTYTTEEYAKKHPKTTVKETDKIVVKTTTKKK